MKYYADTRWSISDISYVHLLYVHPFFPPSVSLHGTFLHFALIYGTVYCKWDCRYSPWPKHLFETKSNFLENKIKWKLEFLLQRFELWFFTFCFFTACQVPCNSNKASGSGYSKREGDHYNVLLKCISCRRNEQSSPSYAQMRWYGEDEDRNGQLYWKSWK